MPNTETKAPRLPPRWFMRAFWSTHRRVYRLTGGEPAWWLNLQANPDAHVDLPDGPREVTGRAAHGDERERLWGRWREIDKGLDALAARRGGETAVVVLAPRRSDAAQRGGDG